MAEGKEELLQLKSQIDATLKREQEALAKKGKTLDVMSWFLGLPTDHRYPAGPPYYPIDEEPTVLGLSAAISSSDWAWTAAGMAVTYGVGHQHAHRIGMPGLRGHRFGVILSLPILVLGWSSGVRRAFLRHTGYLPNGNPSRFPDYSDDRVPYFVKHKVSDKHNYNVSPSAVSAPKTML